ncbi:MAG: hypothetical protein ABI594_17175 [Ginsengibacter sp.]
MKNILSIFLCTIIFSFTTNAQDAAQLLKEPSAWAFERFELPPVFAPDIPYKGAEELRFSPGMFKKDSPDYFTYAFVAQLDNTATISMNDIRNYLLDYFKGLCGKTASDRKLTIDTSKISVGIEKKNNTQGDEIVYNALLNIFGVFTNGAPVKLNIEVKILKDAAASKIYLVFIGSPHAKNDEVWQELYKIQKDFVIPAREK